MVGAAYLFNVLYNYVAENPRAVTVCFFIIMKASKSGLFEYRTYFPWIMRLQHPY